MERQNVDLVHRVRLEGLSERLAKSATGLAVSHSTGGFSGNRVTLHLDAGVVLRLKLFWPVKSGIAALLHIGWDRSVGWVIDVRTAAGDRKRLYAWHAQVVPAQPAVL
ncbi:MAG: hypothetical protein JWN99_543 [Ilumatobacteraceae bacterium]|nr:hypothetical protein [Ilumatobacteraceae bacterium]